MALYIEPAQLADKAAIIALLEQGHLLTEDLPTRLADFVIAKEEGRPIGVAGLERFGLVGLLRSVAVDPQYQGQQIAAQLVSRLMETAQASSLENVYLITNTADRYFERYGFQIVNRQEVPAAIQQTQQFSELCPSSAIVMKRALTQDQS
ncbi:arsenic resistance N-acetyltransferase ArsN2 [Spirosoma pollinicola]|uniref:Amino acid acetyltransferase n=1 Tax=Spirosoma pollinicola TaxID=2057025 RepID=A0A2K8Z9N0_9BACT|nr:arsenic resistance N-acetyltransferase ArsN2 [Spirosoma pollinicola]AUD06567.1 amino acid acetyltransferase [Spirosoma pollinicola]